MPERDHETSLAGCLLGMAAGDALGLPYEGLSRRRAARLLGPPDRQRLFFGRGMVSDDTEHACMVAQSLIEAGGDVERFVARLARRLRWWIVAFPAGVGWATARSCLRLWLGFPPDRSGVESAGNGPLMRAPILGLAAPDSDALMALVRGSTRITHTDPKAEYGAIAIALAARASAAAEPPDPDRWFGEVAAAVGEGAGECLDLLRAAIASVRRGDTTQDFADELGLSSAVSGYTYHTLPIVIHAWLSNPGDYRSAVTSVIGCGGDTDTTAAIVGGIVGSATGPEGIPAPWLERLCEWPRTVSWMRHLANRLSAAVASGEPGIAPAVHPLFVLARNVAFLLIVLWHGLRRLAPPY